MADIIMQTSSQGIAARSQGIATLGEGIASGMRERREAKKEEERWAVKKRFMNAQASSQETAAKTAQMKMDNDLRLRAGLQYAAENNMDNIQTYEYLKKNGSAAEAEDWLASRNAAEESALAQEINTLTVAERNMDMLQEHLGGVETEEDFNRGVAFANEQAGTNIVEGLTGDWKEQLKTIMGPLGTIKEKIELSKKTMADKNKTDEEKLVDAANRAVKSGDPLMVATTEKAVESHVNKKTAITHKAELDLVNAQIKQNGLIAENAAATARRFLGLGPNEAMPAGFSEISNQLAAQQRAGWEPERSDKWLSEFVTVETVGGYDLGLFGRNAFGTPAIKINELAPGAVSVTGAIDPHSIQKQKAEAATAGDEYEYKIVNGKKMRRKKAQ